MARAIEFDDQLLVTTEITTAAASLTTVRVNVDQAAEIKKKFQQHSALQFVEITEASTFDTVKCARDDCKNGLKLAKALYATETTLANSVHKSWTAKTAALAKPFEELIAVLEIKMRQFTSLLERQRYVEQQRIDSENAEKARQDSLAASFKLMMAGKPKEAAAVQAAPVVETRTVLPDAKTTLGLNTRDNWKGSVKDARMALQSILDGKIPMDVIEWRPAGLNILAKLHHEKLEEACPGLEACNKETIL